MRRYKRFLADILTLDGEEMTLHCPNTGSMKNCITPGGVVWFSDSGNPRRKYRCTLEIVTTPTGHLAGINTSRANHLVREAMENQRVPGLQRIDRIQSEVRYGDENSRIDFLVHQEERQIYVEVKNVTLLEGDQAGYFPDSVSARGAKHLREMMAMVSAGHRAMLIFCVQHNGIETVSPACHIDPLYSRTFTEAVATGVEVVALGADLSSAQITLTRVLPVIDGATPEGVR